MAQERHIKANFRLRTTAPFKAAPCNVDRISILCQMVVVTIWHIFLCSFAGTLPPNCIRGPPGLELYSMKLKIQLTAEDAELLARFSVYAKRTLANKRAEYYRKLKPILDHEHLYEDLSAADKKRCQGNPFTVEEILGEKWLREKLRKSLSVLSEPERVVIKLLYKYELTPEQAARKLGVTSSTIRSHKKNALDKLKKEMLEDD